MDPLTQPHSQVIRGYVGDRSSKPVFDQATPFDVLGTGYQRPFELATLRLFNMVGILPKCELTNEIVDKGIVMRVV